MTLNIGQKLIRPESRLDIKGSESPKLSAKQILAVATQLAPATLQQAAKQPINFGETPANTDVQINKS